jgi:DNA-binding winged helix-turn-helix (wHTH) protein
VLDSDTRQLFVRGAEVHLQPKAFQFLELLIQNRPRVVSKAEIHEKLWPETFVSDGTLTSVLAEVRDAIGDDAHQARFVRTAHRVGYAFSGPAQEEKAELVEERQRWSCFLVRGNRRYALPTGESIIGRDPGSAVHLDDPSVSRHHARIIVSAEGAALEDLRSKNGTFVLDGKVVSSRPLSDGDRIRVGSVDLTIRIFPTPDSTLTAT